MRLTSGVRAELEAAKQCTKDDHVLHHLDGALAMVAGMERDLEHHLKEAYKHGWADRYARSVMQHMKGEEDSGKEPCKFCGGSGVLRRAAGDEAPVTCGECRGTGVGERQPDSGKGRTLSEEEVEIVRTALVVAKGFGTADHYDRALALLEGERRDGSA